MVTATWIPSVVVEGDWQLKQVTYSGRQLEKGIYLWGKSFWLNAFYCTLWKTFWQILTLCPGGGRKFQEKPAGRRTKLPTSTGRLQRAPRGPNCLRLPHLGPPPTHPLPIGPEHHLSSGLLPLPFLSCGVGMLVSSSASFLAGPWTCHVPLFSVLLLAGPGASPHCAWGCQWTRLQHPTWMQHTLLSEAQPVPRLPSAPSSPAPRPMKQPCFLAQKPSCTCSAGVLQEVGTVLWISLQKILASMLWSSPSTKSSQFDFFCMFCLIKKNKSNSLISRH